jgi:hypothetical protein
MDYGLSTLRFTVDNFGGIALQLVFASLPFTVDQKQHYVANEISSPPLLLSKTFYAWQQLELKGAQISENKKTFLFWSAVGFGIVDGQGKFWLKSPSNISSTSGNPFRLCQQLGQLPIHACGAHIWGEG